jgi:MHS family proline/betaine transporter-like MFS transporter
MDKKHFAAIMFGNMATYYNFSLYIFLLPTILTKFDIINNYFSHSILAFLIFSLGFIFRPLGGLFFGYIGDIIGRKTSLLVSTCLTIISSLFMAYFCSLNSHLFNTWAVIVGIVMCRLLQCFCTAGEYCSSIILSQESASKYKQTFSSCLTSAAGVFGWLSGSIICSLLISYELAKEWGFLLYLFGCLLNLLSYLIRKNIIESHITSYLNSPKLDNKLFSIKQLYKDYGYKSLMVICLAGLNGSVFYGYLIFASIFLFHFSNEPSNEFTLYTNLGLFSYMLSLPIIGRLTDYIKESKTIYIIILLNIFFPYLFYFLLHTNHKALIIIDMLTASIIVSLLMAISNKINFFLFAENIRCRSISFNYNIGMSFLGGTTPIILQALLEYTSHYLIIGLYLSICSIFTIIFFYLNNCR